MRQRRANERLDDGEMNRIAFNVLQGGAAVQICDSIAMVDCFWWLRLSERKSAAVEDHEGKGCSGVRSVKRSLNGPKDRRTERPVGGSREWRGKTWRVEW